MSNLTQSQREILATVRRALDAYVPTIADNAADINNTLPILRMWKPGAYVRGDVRVFGVTPYKCVQAHDSTANPGWTPDTVPALWMQYHGTSAATARPYIAPQGAHDAYQAGEYITDGVKVHRCKVNSTVYPPATLPASWEAV